MPVTADPGMPNVWMFPTCGPAEQVTASVRPVAPVMVAFPDSGSVLASAMSSVPLHSSCRAQPWKGRVTSNENAPRKMRGPLLVVAEVESSPPACVAASAPPATAAPTMPMVVPETPPPPPAAPPAAVAAGAAVRTFVCYDGGGCGLTLKCRGHLNLHGAAGDWIDGHRSGLACGVGGHSDGLQPAGKRRGVAADRKGDRGPGHGQVVAIANLDDRRHRRFLLNDVDRIFALDHHDAESGRGLAGLRRDHKVREKRNSSSHGMAELTTIDRVRRYAAAHGLWARDERVIAAVSGGSDSVAMLFLLRELASRGELMLAGLAHLHHHIRGADADADAAFCRELAARFEIPAFVGDIDVPSAARRDGVSIEVAGREARQRFYAEAIAAAGASRVAVAHTRDDQAETVLLRLTRGAGTAGLGGMAPRRGPVVRPVLDATRLELQHYLRERGETWREDATNLDRTIPRNLVRHDVLPRLRTINAQADNALVRAADLLRVDADFLETLANAAYLQIVQSGIAPEPSRDPRDRPDAGPDEVS